MVFDCLPLPVALRAAMACFRGTALACPPLLGASGAAIACPRVCPPLLRPLGAVIACLLARSPLLGLLEEAIA